MSLSLSLFHFFFFFYSFEDGISHDKSLSLTECDELLTNLQDKYPEEYKVILEYTGPYTSPSSSGL